MRFTLLLLLVAASALACSTTQTSMQPGAENAIVTRTTPVSAWALSEADEAVGFIVRYEVPGAPGKAYFSVRNRHQQELGIVDSAGRTWRYRAHQREPDWLGTGTILQGAQRVLGANERTKLVLVTLESLRKGAVIDGASAPTAPRAQANPSFPR